MYAYLNYAFPESSLAGFNSTATVLIGQFSLVSSWSWTDTPLSFCLSMSPKSLITLQASPSSACASHCASTSWCLCSCTRGVGLHLLLYLTLQKHPPGLGLENCGEQGSALTLIFVVLVLTSEAENVCWCLPPC